MATKKHTVEKSPEDSVRNYNWATIVYPESATPDWESIIESEGIPTAISPLHDSDVTEDGEIKKPHYHVVFHYPTLKSRSQVRMLVDKIGGVGAEIIQSLQGYIPYLAHYYDTDKAKYKVTDIRSLCGFNIQKYLPKIDTVQLDFDIKRIIREYDIDEFYALDDKVEELVLSGDLTNEHYAQVEKRAYKWKSYLDSRRHSRIAQIKKQHETELQQAVSEKAQLVREGFEFVQRDFDFDNLDIQDNPLVQRTFEKIAEKSKKPVDRKK